jgi:glucose-1-phosphatase
MQIDLNKYEAIIFDLGGVLLNIDYQKTITEFKKLGIHDFEMVYSKARQQRLFDEYEKGTISSEDFVSALAGWCREGISTEEITAAWNAMLLDFPKERLTVLEKLRKSHRTFLLSNTNEIHIRQYSIYLQETFGFTCLKKYFEKQYYSWETGMRKPDREIFLHVLRENGLKPEKTLFIDDSIQHVEGARGAGITAFHLTKDMTILDIF